MKTKKGLTLNPVLVYNKSGELQKSKEIFIIGGLECVSNGLCIYKDNKGEFHILKQRQDRITVNRDSPLSKSYDNNVMFYTETTEKFFSKEQVIKKDNEKADSFALKLANQESPLSFNINDKISVKDAKINIDGYYHTIDQDNKFVKGDKAQDRSIKHIPNLMAIADPLLRNTEPGKTEYRLNIIAKTNHPESSFFLGPVLETSKVLRSTYRDPQIILEGLEDLGDCSFSCGSPLLDDKDDKKEQSNSLKEAPKTPKKQGPGLDYGFSRFSSQKKKEEGYPSQHNLKIQGFKNPLPENNSLLERRSLERLSDFNENLGKFVSEANKNSGREIISFHKLSGKKDKANNNQNNR